MSGRLWLYLGLGVAAYALFLLINLPAAWLSWAAARASGGTVAIAAPSGTVWRGSGQLHIGAAPPLGNVEWRINPFWLVTGRLHAELRAGGPGTEAHAALDVGRDSVVIEQMKAAFPVQLASLVYAPAAFFGPTGRLQMSAERLELNRSGLNGDAHVLWQGAGGQFAGATNLGDYRVELQGRGETANIRLTTLRGDLELTGNGQWRVTGDGELRFNGSARPTADHARLEPLLNAVGRDLGSGRRTLSFTSRAPLIRSLGL